MAAGESYDGRLRLVILDTAPADPAAITEAELAAGVDLSDYLTPAGIDPGIQNGRVDGGSANSSFDSQAPGRHGAQPSGTFKRKLSVDGSTLAWDTLGARGVACTVVYFEDVEEGAAPAEGNDYQCFVGCKTLEPEPQRPTANQERVFQVQFAVGSSVVYGTVAA